MMLWKQIAQNYFKKLPYFFFLISSVALYACSLIPFFLIENRFHIIAQFSALTFVIFGVIMLLQAKEKLSIKLLFISSLSFAIAVACRPTALYWSILIPIMLWDKRKELINAIRYLLAIIIPFAIVGSILAWYNYARFDSPFVFGINYMIGVFNQTTINKVGLIGRIHNIIEGYLFILFNPPSLDITFPFVRQKESGIPLAASSFIWIESLVGIFCFPIMWFLFYVGKVNILRDFIFAGIFISLLNMIIPASVLIICYRYTLDFVWIMAIAALICAFQLQENEVAMRKVILKIFYSCCILTLLLVFFLTISFRISSVNILDPKIHHYLARTFGVICNVP